MQVSPFNQQASQQVFSPYSQLFPSVMLPVQQQQLQQPEQLSLFYILQSQQQQQQAQQLQISQQQPVAYFQSFPGYSQGQLISFMPALTMQQKTIDPFIVGQQLNPQQNPISNGFCFPMISQQQSLCLLPSYSQQQSNKSISGDFSQQQSLNSLSTFSSLQNYSSEISHLNQMSSIETSLVQDNNQVKTETIIEAPQLHCSQIPQQNIQIINNKLNLSPSLNQNLPSLHPLITIINKKPSIKSAVTSSESSSSDDGDDMNPNKDSLSCSDEDSQKENGQNSSKVQDAQVNSSLPIRNNEDPYKTYKYPSQIQNQLRKQVLKKFFKSVPGYLDTLESHISELFQDLDKASIKALCKYWSQFDNPARRTQLKNKEYRQLCNQLQVNSEIKPLGQKCLKEIFGKNNHFSDALRYLYQEFNKDANAFAHRKKNLGMQRKYVQASNRIYHDIFNE